MNRFPASTGPARLHGLEISRERRPSLVQSRTVWFALGFFTAATVAGFLAGLLP